MKKIHRIVCLIIAALMVLSVLALTSCGNGNEKGDNTTAAVVNDDPVSTGEEDTSPKFASADYGGRDFTVYMRTSTLVHYASIYIYCPENATDIVNDQTAARNAQVEEKYNIHFKFIETDDPADTVKTDVAGGNIPYDIVLDSRYAFESPAREGVLRNFLELDIDYTTDWWDKNARKIYGYKDKLFVMPNDVSVSNLAAVRFIWFNKAVLENYNLTSPYDYVAQNNWTIDTFLEMVKSVSAPGPEGTIGTYGLALDSETRNFILTGIGSFEIETDEEDNLICKIGTEYAEKTQSYYDKIRAVGEDESIAIDYSTARKLDAANQSKYGDQYVHTRALFSQGHFLFVEASMGGALRDFEEMPKGAGVVMNPKYDSNQPDYYHKIDKNAIIWAIPKDPNASTDMLTNILNFWAWTSHNTVMEAYYELTLKTKRATDPIMAQMLDTVKGTIHYYISDIFKADVSSFISQAYTTSVSGAWRGFSKKLPKALADLQASIEELE